MMIIFIINVISIFCVIGSSESMANNCMARDYGNGGTVCVCTSQHCDIVESIEPVERGKYVIYTSNKEGFRFNKTVHEFHQKFTNDINAIRIKIDPNKKYQEIIGWGGAFTDSTGINLKSLNLKLQEHLMNSYFAHDGIEYSLCRVPVGGTDFSTRPYTYDDNEPGDNLLEHFNLTEEDFDYKIPYIKQAISLTNYTLKLFASAWSAPTWMKTNNAISGIGFLIRKYYQTWADYHLKFFESYEKEGITFWGMTTGNEPTTAYVPFVKINSMGWTPFSQSQWISNYLGPTIRNSRFSHVKLMAVDDQRFILPWWVPLLFIDNNTRNYVDGIAVHWYYDSTFPAELLDLTHTFAKEKFILGTEACVGDKPYQQKVVLGSWDRGEMYADDIIEDLNHWVSGWTDWNMALDIKGGPTYINNFVDSPIIVNATGQEFYKQPMYYVLGHFSKFIRPLSKRIHSDMNSSLIKLVGFLRPDNGTCLVIYNNKDHDMEITLYDELRGTLTALITKHSINTILYW